MPVFGAHRAWMPGLFIAIAMGGRAEAGVITGAEAVGPASLDFCTVNELTTGDSNNDNAADPLVNRLSISEGFQTPSPIDIVITVANESGDFPRTTEYCFDTDITNGTTHVWFGFQHVIGFGTGDSFQTAPLYSVDFDSPENDPPPASSPFAFLPWFQYSGSRELHWWGGLTVPVPPGEQVTFCYCLDVPNSEWVPQPFRTPTGYTFTLRQYPKVPAPPAPPGWYRGNTHTHSNLWFDSQDPTATMAAFYAALGYDFLVATQHHGLYDFTPFSTPGFLCISGEEITSSTNHTVALGTTISVPKGILSQNVNAVLAQGGVPVLAHPSPTMGGPDAVAIPNLKHMEIHNTFFCCPHDYTDLWDEILSAGKLIYGLAADDSHTVTAHAGQSWIVVRADVLDQSSILAAISAGDFYASTGITLNDYAVDDEGISVDSMNGERVTFIGQNGAILQQTQGSAAQYLFLGNEPYVRAEVQNSYEQYAWMQPVFPDSPPCPWDCDGSNDASVNILDILAMLGQYDPSAPVGCNGGSCDFNNDGCVDATDLLNVLAHFSPLGFGCP